MLPPWLERLQRAALLITAFLFSAGYATNGLVLILATVIAEGILTRRFPWRRGVLDGFFVGFLAVFTISGLASEHRAIATGSTVLAALTIYLAYGLLYRILMRDRRFLIPFLWAWLAGSAAAAGWALVLHWIKDEPAFTPELGKNAVGTTFLMALFLALGLYLVTSSWKRYAAALATGAAVFGVALSYTRGAWVGVAIGILTFFFLTELRHTWRGLVLCAVLGVAVTVVVGSERSALYQRVLTIPDPVANEDRVFLFRTARVIFEKNLILGTGLNTFSRVYRNYRLPGDPNPEIQPFAHNIFLNMAAEGGIPGLATFCAIVVTAIVLGWRWYARSTLKSDTVVTAAAFAAFSGMMVHQLFDGTMISVHLSTGMWFLMAMFAAGAATSDRQSGTWT